MTGGRTGPRIEQRGAAHGTPPARRNAPDEPRARAKACAIAARRQFHVHDHMRPAVMLCLWRGPVRPAAKEQNRCQLKRPKNWFRHKQLAVSAGAASAPSRNIRNHCADLAQLPLRQDFPFSEVRAAASAPAERIRRARPPDCRRPVIRPLPDAPPDCWGVRSSCHSPDRSACPCADRCRRSAPL